MGFSFLEIFKAYMAMSLSNMSNFWVASNFVEGHALNRVIDQPICIDLFQPQLFYNSVCDLCIGVKRWGDGSHIQQSPSACHSVIKHLLALSEKKF